MPGASRERRLATFLFLDIVGSTALAAELGDRRWKDLLERFRRIVHREIKAHGGTAHDWAGDGLFASFPDPGHALGAATAIVEAVHEVGVDIRCGIHTGEAETVDGKLAGLGVHIAARVMALGGPAEILVSGTVRDVMTGSTARFEDRGVQELKGVPDRWTVNRVVEIHGRPVAEPLDAEAAAERIAAVEPLARRRTFALIAAAVLGILAVGAVVILVGSSDAPVTVVALDTSTGSTVETLHDDAYSEHLWQVLSTEAKHLWQVTEDELVERDPATGQIVDRFDLPENTDAVDGGFDAIWAAGPVDADDPIVTDVHKVSPVTGTDEKHVQLPLELADMRVGNGSVWVLGRDGTLDELDPLSLKVEHTYDTDTQTPGTVVPIAGYVWICECRNGHVAQYDPRVGRIVQRIDLPQQGYVIGADAASGSVWLLDPIHNTLTPIDPETGDAGAPLGIGGARITDATVVGDDLWVASQTEVTKIELANGYKQHPFEVPDGVSAGSVAPTPDGKLVWIANCGCPIET